MKIRPFSIFFLLTGAIFADSYRPPNMDKEIFVNKKLSINKILKGGALFSGLLSVARDFDEKENEVDYELRAHALGIAGRLNPDSENFKDLDKDLKDRGRTNMSDEVSKSLVTAKIYRGIRGLMEEKDNEDNKKCAAYCIDIALRLDPESEFQSELEGYQKITGDADWKDMLGSAVPLPGSWPGQDRTTFEERRETIPGGDADKFAGTTSEIYGLHVRTLPNGRHVGGASALSAVALKEKDIDGIEFHIDQKVGDMTGNSLEEVAKLMRTRHDGDGSKPTGYKVSITFEDKDTLLDGPSAGTAMAIILDSLFTGRALDGKFACTGAITQTGKVTPIGGVAGKIRGATNKGCNLVGVPHANIKGVSDVFVLDGIEKLMAIQVFSFETLDQAIEVASKEKSEDVQSTINDFNKVADLIKAKGEDSLKNAVVIALLEDVVEKMPNHQSAQILLSVAKGEEKKILSLGGSFHQIRTNISGIANKIARMVGMEEANLDSEDRNQAKEALAELTKISSKLDSRLKDYNDSMTKVLKSYSEGREDDEKDDEFVKRIGKEWSTAGAAREKLMGDPEIMEELNN